MNSAYHKEHQLLAVGIGNEYCGDDALGPYVIRNLIKEKISGVTYAVSKGNPGELIELWRDYQTVLIIDALVSCHPPGTILRMDLTSNMLGEDWSTVFTHGFDLNTTIEFARTLGLLPKKIEVIGIVGERFKIGSSISPAVQAAMPKLCMEITSFLRQTLIVLSQHPS